MHLQANRQGHKCRGDRAAHACLRSQACKSELKAGGSFSSSAWRPSLTNLLKTYCAIVSLVYASSSTPAKHFLPSRPCKCFLCGPQKGLCVNGSIRVQELCQSKQTAALKQRIHDASITMLSVR